LVFRYRGLCGFSLFIGRYLLQEDTTLFGL